MRVTAGLAALLLLTACGEEQMSEDERAAEDARLVAEVEMANGVKPSPRPLDLQAILYPDIERHDLFGTSCSFVPAGGGLGALFLGMSDAGYFKIGGELVQLAADSGSPELPFGAREKYTGEVHAVQLTIDGAGDATDPESVNYTARLTITDEFGQTVYDEAGNAQCGA